MDKQWSYKWLIVVLLLAAAALGLVVSGRFTAQAVRADAPKPLALTCTVVDVGIFIQRVHVQCTPSVVIGTNTVRYWAYPTSDSAGASRFLSLFETAKAIPTTLTIYYDPNDLSGSTFGCSNNDCRRILGATSP